MRSGSNVWIYMGRCTGSHSCIQTSSCCARQTKLTRSCEAMATVSVQPEAIRTRDICFQAGEGTHRAVGNMAGEALYALLAQDLYREGARARMRMVGC